MARSARGRRWLSFPAVTVIVALLGGPIARAQPRDSAPPPQAEAPPPPVVQNVPPPPVVQNVPPPPVVQNVPPPPVVQNAAPAPLIRNVAPAPVVQNAAPAPLAPVPDLEQQQRRSGKLLLSSLGTYALAYGLTVLLGAIRAAADDPAATRLYIPVIGPLLFWDGTNMEIDGESGAYLILSTLAQSVGILGIFFGIAEMAESDPPQGG